MRIAVAIANVILGVAYCGYGIMTAIEMKRDARTQGVSHFGIAWIFMAFTCGPHHLDHGIHAILGDHQGGPLDLLAVVMGIPAGVAWLSLRIEAFAGGRGDRFIEGTPRWLQAMPTVTGIYLTTLVFGALGIGGSTRFSYLTLTNVVLVGLYLEIGWVLLRTQLHNREPMGGWSLSGLTLTVVFPTCALMHGVFALNVAQGIDTVDIHSLVIDWLSIPAAIYFLWVIHGLYQESLQDWNAVYGYDSPPVEAVDADGPGPGPAVVPAAVPVAGPAAVPSPQRTGVGAPSAEGEPSQWHAEAS